MAHPPNQAAVHGHNMVSFCIGCTACLGCFETQITHNDLIVQDFEDMWLKFTNGKQVLVALGEQEVRRRLNILQPELTAEHGKLSPEECASLLLPLKGAWAAKCRAEELHMYNNHEMWQEGALDFQMWQEAELRAECDAEFIQQKLNPDPLWQELREQHLAVSACRGSVRRAHLEAKARRLMKQRRGPKTSKKVQVRRSNHFCHFDVADMRSLVSNMTSTCE
jgi:hypothetical protein